MLKDLDEIIADHNGDIYSTLQNLSVLLHQAQSRYLELIVRILQQHNRDIQAVDSRVDNLVEYVYHRNET